MFCDSNYATYKETRKSVSGLAATLGGTVLTCLSETQRTVTLSITEVEDVAEKPSVIYEDNQGETFLAKNRQVGIRTKHIDICHHFLRDMVE